MTHNRRRASSFMRGKLPRLLRKRGQDPEPSDPLPSPLAKSSSNTALEEDIKRSSTLSSSDQQTLVAPTEAPTPEVMGTSLVQGIAQSSGELQSSEPLHSAVSSSELPSPHPGLFVLYTPPAAQRTIVDIVVIHGLTGNAFKTWFHEPSGTHWPRDLLKHDFPDSRILCFQYDADVTGIFSLASTNRVSDHAWNMLGALVRMREITDSEERRLVFVAHSLGGLVVQNALTLSRESPLHHIRTVEENTIALLFLGTPHFGADLAKWGEYAAQLWRFVRPTTTDLVKSLRPDSETLANIQSGFQSLLRNRIDAQNPIDISCFYEELPLGTIGTVVPKHSARLLPYGNYGIHANHKDMGKFSGKDDPGYRDLKGELFRPIRKLRGEIAVHLTPMQEECLRSLHFPAMDERLELIEETTGTTFDWIWAIGSYTAWLRSASGDGIYWIVGKPGSGKSTLMKYLSSHPQTHDELNKLLPNNNGSRPIVAVHCFDSGVAANSPLSRSVDGMLRSLIAQIIAQNPSVGGPAFEVFEKMKRQHSSVQWSTVKLEQALRKVLETASDHALCLFIDALDECEETAERGSRKSIAQYISSLVNALSRSGRVCVSSRSSLYAYELAATPALMLDQHTATDISTYVQTKLRPMLNADSRYNSFAEQLVSHANGVFLWVRVAAEMLLKSWVRNESPSRLEARLKELPTDLSELYDRLFKDMAADDKAEAHLLLGLVAASVRPLSVQNLSDALTNLEHEIGEDYAARIQTVCLGLLDVRKGIVCLSHRTVLAYIQQALPEVVNSGNRKLFVACLWVVGLSAELKKASFEHYATLNWPTHARRLLSRDTGGIVTLSDGQFLRWYERFLCVWETPTETSNSVGGLDDSLDSQNWTHESALRRLLEILLFHSINRSIKKKGYMLFPLTGALSNSKTVLHDVGSGLDLRVELDVVSRPSPEPCLVGVSREFVAEQSRWTLSFLDQEMRSLSNLANKYTLLADTKSPVDSAHFHERPESPKALAVTHGIWLYAPEEFSAMLTYRKGCLNGYFQPPGNMTPLQLACWLGLSKIVNIMLENGADPNFVCSRSAFGSPLLTCIVGHAESRNSRLARLPFRYNCMALLLDAGGDPNRQAFGTFFPEPLSPTDLAIQQLFLAVTRKSVSGQFLAKYVAISRDGALPELSRTGRLAYMVHGLYAHGGYPTLQVRRLISSSPTLYSFFHHASFKKKHTYMNPWNWELRSFSRDAFPVDLEPDPEISRDVSHSEIQEREVPGHPPPSYPGHPPPSYTAAPYLLHGAGVSHSLDNARSRGFFAPAPLTSSLMNPAFERNYRVSSLDLDLAENPPSMLSMLGDKPSNLRLIEMMEMGARLKEQESALEKEGSSLEGEKPVVPKIIPSTSELHEEDSKDTKKASLSAPTLDGVASQG